MAKTKTRKLTMKYWDSLEEGSRFRALRKVLSNFPDSTNHNYAKEKAKDMGFVWELLVKHVRIPDDSHYKTYIDRTYLP